MDVNRTHGALDVNVPKPRAGGLARSRESWPDWISDRLILNRGLNCFARVKEVLRRSFKGCFYSVCDGNFDEKDQQWNARESAVERQ
jgi:hypothetical protein